MYSVRVGDRAGRSSQPSSGTALTWPRRARWLAGLCVVTALWLLALAGPASAHAVFVSASPAPGASLTHPPALLRIVFSEPLVPKLSGVTLLASSGATVPARSAGVDPHDSSAYELALPRLRPDRYTVIWHTTSQIDGHFRSGSYTFTVLEPSGAAPPVAAGATGLPAQPAQVPTQVQAATDWAGLAGLFLVVGTALMALLGGAARAPTRRLFGWLLALAGAGTLIGVLDQFAVPWAGTGWQGSALPSVLEDGVAEWLWLRLGAVAVALLAWPRRGRAAGPVRRVVLAAAALAMVVSFAASGHGAASARPVAGLAFMTVHV
ncbi:MAG: copper resistance CopC family protein, partial [Streptosporangiaceae bacterium]